MTDNQRRRPPPELLAAAAQDYQAARERVALAVEGARLVALERGSEIEAFAEAYYVLSRTAPDLAAAIGAAAIVQLANSHNRHLN
ncbi:hypothetical protein WEI85_00120 [Actinomycetes bacterium KLBMP 9797]